jgi:hypothetical protein
MSDIKSTHFVIPNFFSALQIGTASALLRDQLPDYDIHNLEIDMKRQLSSLAMALSLSSMALVSACCYYPGEGDVFWSIQGIVSDSSQALDGIRARCEFGPDSNNKIVEVTTGADCANVGTRCAAGSFYCEYTTFGGGDFAKPINVKIIFEDVGGVSNGSFVTLEKELEVEPSYNNPCPVELNVTLESRTR